VENPLCDWPASGDRPPAERILYARAVPSAVHGFPHVGTARELKFAIEDYWAGRGSADELNDVSRRLRREAWELMRDAGVDLIPSNDFTHYDRVLDTVAMVGAVPERFAHAGGEVDLDTYFAMARGNEGATAMEMTKWFDTNYHYLVPELGPQTRFALSTRKPIDEFVEAKSLGIETKPVLIGPVTFLLLAKAEQEGFDPLTLLDPLLDVYADVLAQLAQAGCEWVQLDEPAFVEDRDRRDLESLELALDRLGRVERRPKLCVSTYFDHAGDAVALLARAPIEGVGLDFDRGPSNAVLARGAGGLGDRALFAGVVDGRNVWACDLDRTLELLRDLRALAGELVVSSSCSLQHVPVDLDAETGLDPELRSWMAFARQKVGEVVALARALDRGEEAIAAELESGRAARASRAGSSRTRDPAVRARVAALTDDDARRRSTYETRRRAQRDALRLPVLPTTTIGSFPQTAEVRGARAALREGEIDEQEYERRMRAEIERVIRLQESLGIDVLVHGEPERNDMVQYFGERMRGYAFTDNAWVRSYGTRHVRPPIVYGDVSRPRPITVDWIAYAQSLTERPVKAMLTGPVTMLKWSYPRDDLPEEETALQLALAIRDEVADLERAGIRIVQVDEPAFREGLPLRRERWRHYVGWAVRAFRVATSAVGDGTQIHTHMCYSEFGDIVDAVGALDADVASVEAARSRMELVADLKREGYRQEIGPGVYDIHSPRVPSADEMAELLRRAIEVLPPGRVWVNPDCGLKTRSYAEAEPSLRNMVEAAQRVRAEVEAA
jgi:5-methyltetrahydropteroyltriglutamate--homocysteine methyltransferase